MRLVRSFLAAGLTMAALALPVNAASAAPGTGSFYMIRAVHSAKCLDIADSGSWDGARIQQWTCNGWEYWNTHQHWYLQSTGTSGVYQIRSRWSGRCLDVTGGSHADGAQIQQWGCNGNSQQRWRLTTIGDNTYSLVAQHSGKCVDIGGGSVADGAKVQQWTCLGSPRQANQRFRFIS